MNPISFSRALRNSGLLAKSSRFFVRDYSSLIVNRSLLCPCYSGCNALPRTLPAKGFQRFYSSDSAFNLPTRTFTFFVLSSLGIVGGFYVISYSLRVWVSGFGSGVAIQRLQGHGRSGRAVSDRY